MTVQELIDLLLALEQPDLPIFIVDDHETYPGEQFNLFVMDDGDGGPYAVLER